MRISLPLYLKGLFLGLIVVGGIFIFAQSAQALTCSWEECQDVWVPGYTDPYCTWVPGYYESCYVPGYWESCWVPGYTNYECIWHPYQCVGKWVWFEWLGEWVWDDCYYYTPGYWESCYVPGYTDPYCTWVPGYTDPYCTWVPGYYESCWVPGYYKTQCTTQYETCDSDWTSDICSSVACQSYYYHIWYTCYSGGGCKFNSTGYYYNDDSCTSLCDSGQCSGGSCVVCECSSGICCDGCHYRSSSYICDWDDELDYGCPWGTGPGDNAGWRIRSKPRYCSGLSSSCSGSWGSWSAWSAWYLEDSCSSSEYCSGGACVACECTSGVCCDGCYYKSSGSQPTGWTDTYTCEGTNGAAATSWITFFDWHCNGTDIYVHVSESRIDTCGTCEYCANNETSCRYYGTGTSCGTKDCDYLDTTCRNYNDVTKYCDGAGNCGDPACNSYTNASYGTKCGTCKICNSSGSCASTPADDSACGTIDCDGLNNYYQSGTQSPTATEYCYYRDYDDITTNRCEGFGNCKDANTSDCTSYSDSLQYSCGTCKYISSSNCTGGTKGSCSNYSLGTSCGTNMECDGAGNCVSICECTSGVCCDGCFFKPLNAQPTGWEDVYRCEGTNGAAAESWITFFDWYCNGTDISVHVKESRIDTCGTCEYCVNNETSCRYYGAGTSCGTNMECDGSGNCVSICECTSGVCCDGCYYKPLDAQPTGWEDVYRCEGTNGADSTSWITFFDWYCNGTDISVHVKESRIDTCGTCEYCLNNETSCRNYAEGTSCGTDMECDGAGNCVACECTSGVCCDGCYYKPLDAQPTGWTDTYTCEGTNGAAEESWITFFDWYCNGTDIYVHVKEEIKDTCVECEYCVNNETTCRRGTAGYTGGEICGTVYFYDKICNADGICVDAIYSSSGCAGECNIEGFRAGDCISHFVVPPQTCSDIGYTSCALPAGPEAGCGPLDCCCCVDDISLSLFSSSDLIKQGESTSATVNINLGYSGKTVSFSASVSPSEPTIGVSFSPSSNNPGNSSTMNINTTSQTPIGTYQITVNGQYDRYIGYNWVGEPPQFWETVTKTTTYSLEVESGDNKDPVTTISGPSPDDWQTNDFPVTLNFSDNQPGDSGLLSCKYQIWSGTVTNIVYPTSGGWASAGICSEGNTYTSGTTIPVGVGKYCSIEGEGKCGVNTLVTDNVGNPGAATKSFDIDWTPPTTEIK